LAAAMALAVVGCGGGNAVAPVLPKTTTTYTTGLNSPKHMVFKNGNLYIADQNSDTIKIAESFQNYLFLSGFRPIGMASNGTDIFSTGVDSNTGQVVFKNSTISSMVPTGGNNFYGLTFAGNFLYVAEVSPPQIVKYQTANNFDSTSISQIFSLTNGSPQGLGTYASEVYATVSDTGVSANNSVIKLTAGGYQVLTSWGTFNLPNAIVFDSNYAYIANKGNTSGDGGYISRKNMLDSNPAEIYLDASKGIWSGLSPGFCGLAGLAIKDGYLYASNGACTGSVNANTVLKIKL
jgi:hypothetical protein